ncbi:DNA-directed RNA polymerase subunit beta [Paenibacillus lutrae]|uniref:DNA-directed RNA polymerase subunit beta n=1 Tax=Paenibacillus lutrae TaxID=2078573 RepID=A0A7X3K0U3_9BACL|nr:DNA-directed RNA polymerase subunit beta [Paenibacillus lutrae]MVP01523.1 DNA-directed RNA polymerase subunit beta [Paenibacillus lutrae]
MSTEANNEEKPSRTEQSSSKPKKRSSGVSTALRILTILRIPLICLAALFIGLWLGYAWFGGQPASDIFKISTWKHLFNLVFAD